MPRFYFDVRDNGNVLRDHEGLEFAGMEEARSEAARAAGEMLKDVLPDGRERTITVEVRGESRGPLFGVRVVFAVEPIAPDWPPGIRRRLRQ
jgi:hypothetical protein